MRALARLRPTVRLVPVLACLILGGALNAHAATCGAGDLAGLPLARALDLLRACGLELIYSSDLVRPEMRVEAEPAGVSPRAVLDELLAAQGLAALDGPGGRILIVDPHAQARGTGGIEGRLVAVPDLFPVPHARVLVAELGIQAVTSRRGTFALHGIPPGRYHLETSLGGTSLGRSEEIVVVADRTSKAALRASLPEALVEKLIVTPEARQTLQDQPEARLRLTNADLQTSPNLGGDLNRTVSRQPGIAGADRSTELSIRGGHTDEVLFMLDGLEILDPFHLKALQSFSGIVDARAIDHADILTGPFPAEYGDRMSGVIDLSSDLRPGASRTIAGGNFINSHYLSEGALPGGTGQWRLSARAWYPDAVIEAVTPTGEEIRPKYSDLFGKVRMRLSDSTTLTGDLLLSYDAADYSTEAGGDPEEEIEARTRSQYAWLRLESALTQNVLSRTHVSFGRVGAERNGSVVRAPEETLIVQDRRWFDAYGLKQDWSVRASESILLKLGLEARRVDGTYRYFSEVQRLDGSSQPGAAEDTAGRAFTLTPSGDQFGAYAAGRFKLHRALTTELGVRWDRQTQTSGEQLSPRINLLVAPGERGALRLGWGRFYQSQGVHELQVEDGLDEFSRAQLSEHSFVSFERNFARGLQFKASVYSKRMSNVRPRFENLFDPLELFPEAEADRVLVAPQRAESRGVELFLASNAAPAASWWTNYAYSSAEDIIDGERVPRSWDQRHAVNFGLAWRPSPAWSFDVAGVYHTGWPTTGLRAEAVEAPDGSLAIQPVIGARNAERFPAYHRLDLKVSRHAHMRRGRLSFYLEVINLYDQKNVCCVDEFRFTPQADGSVRTIRDYDYWLGILPTLGVVWELGRGD